MNRRNLCVTAVLVLLAGRTWACEGNVPPIDYAGTWPRQDYRLLLIAPAGSKSGDAMVSTIESFLKDDGKDCNLEFARVNAGAADAQAVAVVTDPQGKPLVSFTGKVSREELKNLTTSPAREKIAKGLLDHPLMLLIVEGSDKTKNVKAKSVAKKSVKMATELFPTEQLPGPPLIITVKADDPAEAGFMKVLRLPTDLKEPRMTMLMGNAKIVEPPSPRISKERILDRFQRLVAALEVVFPYMFGPDVLMPIAPTLLP